MTEEKEKQEQKVLKFEVETKRSIQSIIGQDHIKKELADLHTALTNLDLFNECGASLPSGILMIGPPGVGKTFSVRAAISDTPAKMAYISVSDVVSVLADGRASNLKALLSELEDEANGNEEEGIEGGPVVLVMDEIDYLLSNRKRHNTGDATISAINLMLEWMDGLDVKSNIIVIGCTNLVENMDPAFLRSGRFDKKLFFNDLSSEDVAGIINLNIKEIKEKGSPICKPLSKKQLNDISEHVEELSKKFNICINGADAKYCVENAIKNKVTGLLKKYTTKQEIKDAIASKKEKHISIDDLKEELDHIAENHSDIGSASTERDIDFEPLEKFK